MPKFLAICATIVALVALLVFGLDLALQIPFGRFSALADLGFVIGSAILAYLGFSAFRDS